jgi:hypothetical protein
MMTDITFQQVASIFVSSQRQCSHKIHYNIGNVIANEFKSQPKQNSINKHVESINKYVEAQELFNKNQHSNTVNNNLMEFMIADDFNPDDWIEPEENIPCSICFDDLPLHSTEVHKLECGHHFHDECLDDWGKYKPGDFIKESKHLCPICRQGKICLDSNNELHSLMMNMENLWLQDKYVIEGKNLENKDIVVYRFCLTCRAIFEAGNMDCGIDETKIREYCVGCDPMARTKPCPGCDHPITWLSGCQRIACTTCKIHFCFIHLRTEQSIKDEMIQLRKDDPEGILQKFETSRLSLGDDWENTTRVGSGSFIYRCTDCVKEGTLYTQFGQWDKIKHMDEIQNGL